MFSVQPQLHSHQAPSRWGGLGRAIWIFIALNVLFTLLVTFSPLNQRFNFKYGNFLPTKLVALKQKPQTNVLFLGTSQTNNGFIPAVFDAQFSKKTPNPLHSFNLGLPNNHYDIMLAYLQYHQRHFGKPQWVLLELSPTIQEKEETYYFLPALYYRSLVERDPAMLSGFLSSPLISGKVKTELLTAGLSSLRQYRHTFTPVNLLNKVSGKLKRVLPAPMDSASAAEPALDSAPNEAGHGGDDTDHESEQGSEELPTWVQPAFQETGWYPKPQSMHMKTPAGVQQSIVEAKRYYIDSQRAIDFEKLNALLSYCQAKGIPVVLVSWPNHPGFVQAFQQSPLAKPYQDGVVQLTRKYAVPRIDLNRHLPPNQNLSAWFADPRHLTPEGARFFSERLASILASGNSASASEKR